jgi:phage repressor protein C with HTH and peptisase S24 domain
MTQRTYTNFSKKTRTFGTFHEIIDSGQFFMTNYLDQLTELLKRFTQAEIADLLDVTERAIQFWTAEENKKIPFPKTQKKIDELFTNLIKEGKSIEELKGAQEPQASYNEKRRLDKLNSDPFMVPLVPIKAQAGYVRAIDQATFIDTLEKYALPPGVNPHGAIWRYWEVEGESMEPAFHSGDVILTSQVHQFDWENLRNFYLYVIVTAERVLFKRVYCKNQLEWVLISENEEHSPQQLLPIEYIKEVWVFRRSIKSKEPPTKEFKILV